MFLSPTTTSDFPLPHKEKQAKATGGRNKNRSKRQISVNYVEFQKSKKKTAFTPSFLLFHRFLAVLHGM